jgi:hypothetical protein
MMELVLVVWLDIQIFARILDFMGFLDGAEDSARL